MVSKKADAAFQKRMQECVDALGSAAALARSSGISHPVISDYLNGISEPTRPRLVNIAQAAGFHLEWLATGNGEKSANSADSLFVAIPVLPTAGSSGGGLAVEFSEIGAAYPLPRVWAQRHKLKESNSFAIWGVEGMEPTCSSSDILIATNASLGMGQNGVFIIKKGGLFNVRRLQWKDDCILIKSDSGLYEDDTLPLDTDIIVARVIFVAKLERFSDSHRQV
jgi:phage repressor protein C with HTH and peptisase S24 domain